MKLLLASVPKFHPIHFFSSHFLKVCTALGPAKVPRESRLTERSPLTLAGDEYTSVEKGGGQRCAFFCPAEFFYSNVDYASIS